MDVWYYKAFDSDFGPITFDELIELVKNQSLSREDEVRFGESGLWRRAGSIGPLMAHFPFEAAKKVVAFTAQKPSSESRDSAELDSQSDVGRFENSESVNSASPAVAEFNASIGAKDNGNSLIETPVREISERNVSVADQIARIESRWWNMLRGRGWRCMIRGMEYGPVELPQLIDWAAKGLLSHTDHVRLGMEPYVPAGEFPELFSILPDQFFEDLRPATLPLPFQSGMIGSHAFHASPTTDQLAIPVGQPRSERTTAGAGESGTIAGAPGIESQWWCKIKGKEYGPIDWSKLIDWASTGRMGRKDYVRSGNEPYVLADEFPALFPKLPNQKPEDLRSEAGTPTQAGTASSSVTMVSSRTGLPKPAAVESLQSSHQEPKGSQEAASISSPTPRPTNIGLTPEVPPATIRPAVPMTKPRLKQKSEGITALITSPVTLLIAGLLVLVPLIYFAIPVDQTANVARVKQMETLLTQVTTLRSGTVNSAEAKTVSQELGKAAKKIAEDLNDTRERKALKVLTLAKNLEKLAQQDLSKPTGKDKKMDTALSTAKSSLVSVKRSLGMK